MKRKLVILSTIFIVFTGCFLFNKPFNNKTKPMEDIIMVYPANRVITNEVILIGDEAEGNLPDIDLNDEKELEKLAKKQYEQGEKGEIIFTEENQ
ncbi:hypothetical protein [Peribacillus sp. CSMR9]|uniref:hypothetical protein n=1 Tax=Peribacillus sp. CSMR9 TaxID=2981350 RepID=UPI00295373C7|nr:hypothetical protein [Peribacillus sp. CSMR9]MDV7766206.1 hypothetical protein [Peribacillus sp. CSMR9]